QPLRLRTRGLFGLAARQGIGGGKLRIAARLGLRDAVLHVAHVLLELTNTLAERAADLRDALGSEENEHDEQNDHQLAKTEICEHGTLLLEKRPGDQVRDEYAEQA